uniref:Uncharacterized protein n=1 Tax=Cajanus cajan TaxID=3821 RepID=A0A151SS94_CAJCA|nr:hypothetical protein KK1_003930 [Cajanus cajan]
MSRSRLLWFTFGFASTYAVFSQSLVKDLLVERIALTSHIDHHFRNLEARLSRIESSSSDPSPDKGTTPCPGLTILVFFSHFRVSNSDNRISCSKHFASLADFAYLIL